MERNKRPSGITPPRDKEPSSKSAYQRDSFVDSVLTDDALGELKKQSVNGCLLCSFDT